MPTFRKSPPELVARFDELASLAGTADRKQMFGYPTCVLHGNMFMGLHEDSLILRLAEPDRVETWMARGRMRLKGTEYHYGQPAAAAADFREVLHRRPDDFELRVTARIITAAMMEASLEWMRSHGAPNR